MGVIPQAIKQLRAISLGVNWLKFNALDIGLFLGASRFWLYIHSPNTLPNPGHAGEGA
jgi:hypothetical protein